MARRRMILSLNTEMHSILMELSKETDTPAAAFVVELLETSKEDIKKITEAVKQAKRNPSIALNLLNEMISGATANLSGDFLNINSGLPDESVICDKLL